jgi:hypothetical protein
MDEESRDQVIRFVVARQRELIRQKPRYSA